MSSRGACGGSARPSLALIALAAVVGCGSVSPSSGADAAAGSSGAAGAGGGGSTGGAGTGAAGTGSHAGTGGSGSSLPLCPGVQPLASGQKGCRTSDDCGPGFWECGPSYISGGCGACLPPQHLCTTDADCGDRVCVPAPLGPCECGGPGTTCAARCTATSCAAGDSCNAATGHCGPTPCSAGFTCGAGYVCAADRAGADVHGCVIARCATDGYTCPAGYACKAEAGADPHGCAPVTCVGGAFKCPANTDCDPSSTSPHHCARRACTADAACDCGACIQGSCQDRLFVCSPPPPP